MKPDKFDKVTDIFVVAAFVATILVVLITIRILAGR